MFRMSSPIVKPWIFLHSSFQFFQRGLIKEVYFKLHLFQLCTCTYIRLTTKCTVRLLNRAGRQDYPHNPKICEELSDKSFDLNICHEIINQPVCPVTLSSFCLPASPNTSFPNPFHQNQGHFFLHSLQASPEPRSLFSSFPSFFLLSIFSYLRFQPSFLSINTCMIGFSF